jgi:hypothetical protein
MAEHEHDNDPMGFFNIQDFKNWMKYNGGTSFNLSQRKTEGVEVEPRVPLRRIISKMEPESGEAIEMAKDFRESGGRIVEADVDMFLIEVASGKFYIPRNCVRRT